MNRLAVILAFLGASPAVAENHFVEMAEDALSNAQVFEDYRVPTAEDVLAIPVETDLPQTSMDAPALQEAGTVAAAGDTAEGTSYRAFSDNAVEWSIQSAVPTHLDLADQVVADPLAQLTANPFSTSSEQCTVTDFSDAPEFERTCERTRDIYASACTSTLDIAVIRTEQYQCHLTPTGVSCEDLQASPLCVETERVCNLQDIDGICIEEVATHTCSSDAPMTFTAPQIGVTSWGAPIMSWATSCDPSYVAQSCGGGETTCTSGPSVESVNGLLVPVECTVQETVYECGASSYSSTDCSAFEADPGCTLIDSACYLDTPDGQCGAYEDTYRCGSSETTAFSTSCPDVNVCVGGVCQSVPQETNSDLPLSMAAVGLLNSMADEWHETEDTLELVWGPDGLEFQFVEGELAYFNTSTNYCRVGILGTYNCCRDSGWALGVFTQCREHELELVAAQEAGRAVYIGTFCRRRVLFVCRERARRYCIFSGRIAREVSYQAQHQLYGRFECRALTHAEMEQIDWRQIDLSPVFGEMLANIDMPNEEELIGIIQSNTSNLAPQVVDSYE